MARPKKPAAAAADAPQLSLEEQIKKLLAAGKKRALMAAIFFGKAGENELAVQLFMALGEQQRAVELLQRAGDPVTHRLLVVRVRADPAPRSNRPGQLPRRRRGVAR